MDKDIYRFFINNPTKSDNDCHLTIVALFFRWLDGKQRRENVHCRCCDLAFFFLFLLKSYSIIPQILNKKSLVSCWNMRERKEDLRACLGKEPFSKSSDQTRFYFSCQMRHEGQYVVFNGKTSFSRPFFSLM